jgi:signal peptidase I
MEPTLHCARPAPGCRAESADLVVIDLVRASALRRGDIVLFQTPPLARVRCGAGGRYVKRVIGLPGETVSERQGHVYVNGTAIAEPYVRFRDNQPKRMWRVSPGMYFLLGDNRPNSCDSRIWGSVPAGNIVGRASSVLRFR